MATFLRRKKLKECDMSGSCGGDAGMSLSTMSLPYAPMNATGMGAVIPPSDGTIGSGDKFSTVIGGMSVKTGPRYKIRKGKKKKVSKK